MEYLGLGSIEKGSLLNPQFYLLVSQCQFHYYLFCLHVPVYVYVCVDMSMPWCVSGGRKTISVVCFSFHPFKQESQEMNTGC